MTKDLELFKRWFGINLSHRIDYNSEYRPQHYFTKGDFEAPENLDLIISLDKPLCQVHLKDKEILSSSFFLFEKALSITHSNGSFVINYLIHHADLSEWEEYVKENKE